MTSVDDMLNGILCDHRIDAALAVHTGVIRAYEFAYNTHTFDFEKDIGRFVAPDITIVSDGKLGPRSLLSELSHARAEYVCNTNSKVVMDFHTTCVADLDTAIVLVAEGDFTFVYPDRTEYALRLTASSTLRAVDGTWVFQHVHLGKGSL